MIFTFENNFDPSAIKVVTNNNVVYLMGVVGPELADQASDIASKSVGVEKVVRVFQYIT
jgi:osmotically-inducible protein OsmY